MLSKHSFLSAVPALALALVLAGCGGGNRGSHDFAEGDGTPDSFISRVIAIVSSMSETDEPEDIGSIEVTMPEETEPVPVS
jgi:hypothetical protein